MTRFYQNLLGVHHDHFGKPDSASREVWGQAYESGEAMPIAAALQEAKLWLRSLTVDKVSHIVNASDARGATDAESEFLNDRAAKDIEHPFAAPCYWAAFIVIGDDDREGRT